MEDQPCALIRAKAVPAGVPGTSMVNGRSDVSCFYKSLLKPECFHRKQNDPADSYVYNENFVGRAGKFPAICTCPRPLEIGIDHRHGTLRNRGFRCLSRPKRFAARITIRVRKRGGEFCKVMKSAVKLDANA